MRFLFSVVIALLLTHSPALAGTPLTPHTAEYKIKISVLGGRLRTNFMQLPRGYRAESVIEATGMSRIIARGAIREASRFSLPGGALLPDEYDSADSLTSDKQVVDFEFDWKTNEVSGFIDGEPFNAPLDGNVHDRVSLQYGLMYDLLNGEAAAQYSLQDAEKLKLLQIRNVGEKAIKVPYGVFDAVGIQHQAENSSRVTTLWCAEELGYLPVVIEQHRKGKLRMRAVLSEYTPLPQTQASAPLAN